MGSPLSLRANKNLWNSSICLYFLKQSWTSWIVNWVILAIWDLARPSISLKLSISWGWSAEQILFWPSSTWISSSSPKIVYLMFDFYLREWRTLSWKSWRRKLSLDKKNLISSWNAFSCSSSFLSWSDFTNDLCCIWVISKTVYCYLNIMLLYIHSDVWGSLRFSIFL